MKKKSILSIAIITIICVSTIIGIMLKRTSVISTNNLLSDTDKSVNVSFGGKNGIPNYSVTLNSPIIKNENNDYDIRGIDVITKASKLLGATYTYGNKAGAYNNNAMSEDDIKNQGIDCSGLVWWTLKSLNLSMSGFNTGGAKTNIPIDTRQWIYDKTGNFYAERKAWKYSDEKKQWQEINKGMGSSISKSNLKVNNKDVNVLKINDPITSNLRYYEYYDKNGNKKELPMGTIIISDGEAIEANSHAWICIGDLGTSNASEAAKILKDMHVISEGQEQSVKSVNNNCTYWRIESTSDTGRTGVTINNADPGYGEGGDKKMGPIWAFQVASDITGKYKMNIVKKDEDSTTNLDDDSDALAGAEFEVIQYKNASSTGITGTSKNNEKLKTINAQTPIYFSNNNEITIDNTTVVDKYTIKETKAPAGYKLNGGQITLEVTKKASENEYSISNVRVRAGSFARDLKPGSNNTVQITLGLNAKSDGKAQAGYVIGVQISKNSITITYKNSKSTKDIDVVINKTNLSGDKIPNVKFNYWVFNTENGRPNEENISKTIYSQSNEYLTIKGMKQNTSKYVWITETNENYMYTNGFFDTSGLENTTRYIYMKIICDNNGNIKTEAVKDPYYLCEITNGELKYLARNSTENTVKDDEKEDSNKNNEYYIETDKISTKEESSDGHVKVIVPIRNPSSKTEYSLGIGKEMFNGNLNDYNYDEEKNRINTGDTSNLVSGAKFEVKKGASNRAGGKTDWKDIGEIDPADNKAKVTTEEGKFVDITGALKTDTNFMNLWFRFSEIEAPEGTEKNEYTYFVEIDCATYDSDLGNRQMIVYRYSKTELGNIPTSGYPSTKEAIFEGGIGEDGCYVDAENGVIITFDVKSLNIKFLMIDKVNTNNYNINIAKLSKSDIKDFESGELNSDEIKKKFVKNVEFETTQKMRNRISGEILNESSNKITTIDGDYTSAYSDITVTPNYFDVYTFKETSAPYNFELYDKTIEMNVFNEAVGSAYEAIGITVGVDLDNDGNVGLDEMLILQIDSNDTGKMTRAIMPQIPSHGIFNENIYAMIEKTDTDKVNITLILADETIEGSYKMNIVKKELKDNSEDNYSNDNAKYISTLSNAKFSVKQLLNNSEDSDQGTMLPEVTTQDGTVSSFTDGVSITDISSCDTYWINETSTPASFSMNKLDLKLDIYKNKESNKYIVDYVKITDQTRNNDDIISKGETLYINSKRSSREYFENYVVAITLMENDGSYEINITWRNEKPTYNIPLVKTNANTGKTINAIAQFDIQMYEDENFTNKAKFIDVNGNDLNKTYQTTNGKIDINDIVIPDIESGSKTNYLTITEKDISDKNYKILSGTLVIPITYTRDSDGKLTHSKGTAYFIDNIDTKNRINGKINPDLIDADATDKFDNAKITTTAEGDSINVIVPNEYPGEIAFELVKYGNPVNSGVIAKKLNGAEFEIVINRTGEDGESEEIYRSNPYDTTGVNTEEEDGVIKINNLKIRTGDSITFNIREINTISGYEIPEELKNGITYTAKIGSFDNEKQEYNIELENNSNVSEDVATANIFKNKTIEVGIENNQVPQTGKYKITLVKSGSDSKILSDVVFHRKVCIRKNSKITDEDYNIEKEDDLNPTDNRGSVIVTKDIETNDSETVNIPVKGVGSPDIYEITENDLTGINAKLYKKIPEKLNLEITKGIDEVTATTYANVAIFSVGEEQNREYIYINTLTNEWKRWMGTRDDINDTNKLIEAGTYTENTEIPLNFVLDGVKYSTSIKMYTDSENLITNIVVGVVNPEIISISKEKQWVNVENADLYKITACLYENGEATNKIQDVIGNRSATFNNLYKYDENGNEIKYEIKEIGAYYRTSETSLWNELEEGTDYVADEENDVFINTPITPGKYKIMLSKIDKDTQNAISGVTFNVNDVTTDPTGSNGLTYVKDKDGKQLEVNIDKDNFNVTDTYEITEINLNNKGNDYYKIKGTLKVNVTKARLTDNNQIIYKLDSVSFESGTVGSDGIARKEVTLENNEKTEVTVEIIGNTVKITIPNKEKNGKYSLKLIKYKKGTQTAVAGTKFHLIGGNIGNSRLEHGTENLSETNYSEIITETTPVPIWSDTIAIKDVAIPDTYTLKEVDVGESNTDMFLGFTEQIKITVNKNDNYNVESVGLTVGGKEATEENGKLVFSKTIHNQTVRVTLSLDKSTKTIILEVENPVKYGSFDFNLVKYI